VSSVHDNAPHQAGFGKKKLFLDWNHPSSPRFGSKVPPDLSRIGDVKQKVTAVLNVIMKEQNHECS
jgi:hypothetical protein